VLQHSQLPGAGTDAPHPGSASGYAAAPPRRPRPCRLRRTPASPRPSRAPQQHPQPGLAPVRPRPDRSSAGGVPDLPGLGSHRSPFPMMQVTDSAARVHFHAERSSDARHDRVPRGGSLAIGIPSFFLALAPNPRRYLPGSSAGYCASPSRPAPSWPRRRSRRTARPAPLAWPGANRSRNCG
jgi:hypothetical protein